MKILKNILKTLFGAFSALGIAGVFLLAYTYLRIETYPVYDDIAKVRPVQTGLLLGTAKFVSKGVSNDYYTARIDAAARLYKAGKIKKIIASGDFSTRYYNEPKNMRADLIASGVSPKDILMDYAGLRTFDSIKRCNDVFAEHAPLIISQKFHCKRSLFIADNFGMNGASAFAAGSGDGVGLSSWRNFAREVLARAKAFIDVGE